MIKIFTVTKEEYSEIVKSPYKHRLAVWGMIDTEKEQFYILLGDYCRRLCIPFSACEPNSVYSPDFSDPQLIDYGQTLKLGDYEIAIENCRDLFKE